MRTIVDVAEVNLKVIVHGEFHIVNIREAIASDGAKLIVVTHTAPDGRAYELLKLEGEVV